MLLALTLALCGQTFAQTEPKCNTNDKDCPKVEKEALQADEEQTERPLTAVKFDTVKFKPNFSGIAKRDSTTASANKAPAASEDMVQQQVPPEEDAQELAERLSNPVASLISVPFQNNFDFGMGPNGDGFRYTLNFQPVIPVAINKEWNLISRTIVPIIGQKNVVGTTGQFGLGDIVQSFFFSPNKSVPFIWGVGPVLLVPTGTNQFLGTQKFGIGPTALVMRQQGKWSYGLLMNHIWSVAGKSSRADVSSTFLQPFISYTTKTAWTYSLTTESTYNWKGKVWSAPVHFTVTKLVMIGKRPVSVGGALRCWTATTPSGPEGCGFRLLFTPLFPKK